MKILTEDEVIDAVIALLQKEGWRIEARCTADECGDDIIATRDGERLVVEAKGAGSSKPHTNRYGREFSAGQVFDHVAKAILKALRVVATRKASAAVALPDNASHRKEVGHVLEALQQLGIAVFWVSADGSVKVDRAGRP